MDSDDGNGKTSCRTSIDKYLTRRRDRRKLPELITDNFENIDEALISRWPTAVALFRVLELVLLYSLMDVHIRDPVRHQAVRSSSIIEFSSSSADCMRSVEQLTGGVPNT